MWFYPLTQLLPRPAWLKNSSTPIPRGAKSEAALKETTPESTKEKGLT